MENVNSKSINKILYFSLLVFSLSLILFIAKYSGLFYLLGIILYSFIPVFIAVFVSFILEPFISCLEIKGVKRKYGVLIVYSFILLFWGLLLYFTIPSLVEQVKVFVSNIPDLITIITKFLGKTGFSLDEIKIGNTVNDAFLNISKKIMKYIESSFSILFNIILGISGALFLSFDFLKFKAGIKKYIPTKIKRPIIYYFQNFLPFVHKYFVGILIDSILIFVISMFGFFIIDIEYILVLSLIIAITNLIPIIGPYIGGIPAAIVGFSVSSNLGISAIIVVVIVQLIESNFLQPLILKNAIKLHPLEGILGISLFGALLGVIGMILSPILVVAIKLLFIPYNENENKILINS